MKKTTILITINAILLSLLLAILISYLLNKEEEYKLVCKSDIADITLVYNNDEIIEYTSNNINFDILAQNILFEQVGKDKYIDEFKTWFNTEVYGPCS